MEVLFIANTPTSSGSHLLMFAIYSCLCNKEREELREKVNKNINEII